MSQGRQEWYREGTQQPAALLRAEAQRFGRTRLAVANDHVPPALAHVWQQDNSGQDRQRGQGELGLPARLLPMTMLPRRSRMSGSDVASARMAMISEDTVMSKPVSL